MIPSVVRDKIWKYNHGRESVRLNSMTYLIVDVLYPEKKKTPKELHLELAKIYAGRDTLKKTLLRLKKKSLVGRHERRYFLRDLGRWFAISGHLDLPFLDLCVLACACCAQTRCANTTAEFFMRFYFERILGEYYAKKRIDNAFSNLKGRGFAERYAKTFIRIYPEVLKDLMSRYGTYFDKLEAWLYDLKANELEIFEKVLEGFSWDKYQKKQKATR